MKKKKISPEIRSYPTWGLENSKKMAKKLKNIIPTLFLSKPDEIGREREKKFNPEFRSYPTWARKFPKKSQKNSKN